MPLSHHPNVAPAAPVVAIFGPTAVGKSRVAAGVAAAVGGEIVSADSMQVYRGLPILTDQPPAELLALAPHHLVGRLELGDECSAARFVHDAAQAIASIGRRGRLPVIVGGTGLYVRALLGDFSFGAQGGPGVRRGWDDLIARKGKEAALEQLKLLDPAAAANIDAANPRRLVRALEAATGGRPVSCERDRLWSAGSRFRTLTFGLMLPREELYRRIDQRVERMLAAGAIDEVRVALSGSVSRTARQAIGFDEIAGYLSGKATLPEAAAAIKQKSRRYAKRQLTWMRKMPDVVRIDLAGQPQGEPEKLIGRQIRAAGFASAEVKIRTDL